MQQTTTLGTTVRLNTSCEEAIAQVTAALKTEGFGVLTEIDVQATFKQKLGVDFRPFKILGACNPPLAYKALTEAPEVGLLLPCNVTVSEAAPGQIDVSFVNPEAMLEVVGQPALKPVAQDAHTRFQRVIAALGGGK